MHLSKLQLLGFKSFADATTLEFGPGITAVVGPNGSGKSNIVDAMLWTLGERSAKALRGHASTDVIFGGTSVRKPTGLCEVSLFFNNESGALPLDFKEVQVTRRLFRDGAGEYALGGSKCRLRDVTDLFLDTGVGPDAGCIISQGEIDAILSAKPEDRRGLIEGAAGIQKYHARRNETKKRLEKVGTDLLRVGDITGELESQLEPLRAQAQLAREYDVLVARLKWLQLAVLKRDYQTRIARLETARSGAQSANEKANAARSAIENLERLEAVTSSTLRELEVRVETLSRDLTDAVGRLKSSEGELAVSRERRRSLSEQQQYQAREIGILRARIASTNAEIASTNAELTQTQTQNSGLNESAAHAEAKLGAAQAQLSDATRALQRAQSQVLDALRAGQNRREQIATNRAESAALETRRRELQSLVDESETERQSLGKLREHAAPLVDEIRAKLKNETAFVDAQNALKSARAGVQNATQNLNSHRETRARTQSRARVLRELEESLEGFAGGTRAVLQAIQNGQLAPDYVPVADAVRAPAELELALETALGAGIHNLICARSEQAKIAIEWLKSARAGRATFLPLDSLRTSGLNPRTLDVLNDRAVLGVASQLVECRAEHQNAVDYLLGRVVVVRTIDDAIRLARRCENGARLVTLDGELVLPAGAITGGAGRQKSSGLLARKRELDEIDARLDELETEIASSQTEIQRAQTEVARTENALREIQNEQNEWRQQLARQERELETIERDARKNATQREAIESQIRANQTLLEQKHALQKAADSLVDEDASRARSLESAVESARLVAAQKQVEKDAVALEVADVRAQFGATLERLQSRKRTLNDLERALRDAQNQVRAKELQIERATSEDAQIVANESELVARLERLSARRADLESELEQARTLRGEALERGNRTAMELKSMRETLKIAEEEAHRLEVRIASTQAEIVDIERRLSEEFGLAPNEALGTNEVSSTNEFSGISANGVSSTNELSADVSSTNGGKPFVDETPFDRRAALEEIEKISLQIGGLGAVNVGAVAQFDAVRERLEFLTEQKIDLETGRDELNTIIADIDNRIREQFTTTFRAVQEAFAQTFDTVFGGGKTHLALTDETNLLETGIDLRVQMPGKSAQDISLLSGGERALTALAFLLAITRVRPAPFVILDEVDAPLDGSNVSRFIDLLREFTDSTQFIVITHNNGTMQAADVLYGVTQQEAGVSTLMSVRLADDDEMKSDRRVAVL